MSSIDLKAQREFNKWVVSVFESLGVVVTIKDNFNVKEEVDNVEDQ